MNQEHISRSVANVLKFIQTETNDPAEQMAILGTAKAQLTETLQATAMRQALYDALKGR